ncbi:Abi family protein [Sulfobacillus thermosulfidooxidans]|uniref:Abi family protein n=1 Tax=Sulfobacillus thermosulfidooxidans TaxID=28034 RepID=UPI0006B4BEC0|nr:Abi family protein [Sulfobacillus thermosulfidooxidans]
MSQPSDVEEPAIVKNAKSFEEQLEILRNRGLVISDTEQALEILTRIKYYRLTGYALFFMDNTRQRFRDSTTFDQIIKLADFDQKFRSLLTGILEPIEIAFRTRIAYELAHRYGPLGYKNPDNFTSRTYHDEFIKVFTGVFILRELYPNRQDWKNFLIHLEALLSEYESIIDLDKIGFPPDWQSLL